MLLVTFQKGYYLGLDKALHGAGLSGKLKKVALSGGTILMEMDGAMAPALWARGEYEAVLTYLRQDARMDLAAGALDSCRAKDPMDQQQREASNGGHPTASHGQGVPCPAGTGHLVDERSSVAPGLRPMDAERDRLRLGGFTLKRLLMSLALSAILLFVTGAATLAAPLVAGEAGQIVIFADYDEWYSGFVGGAGYAIMDGVTVGGYYDLYLSAFGVFADLSLGPIIANYEIEFYEGLHWGKVSACYAFDLAPFKLSVGLGSDFGSLGGAPFARAAADLAGGSDLHLFAAVDCYYNDNWVACKTGLSLAL